MQRLLLFILGGSLALVPRRAGAGMPAVLPTDIQVALSMSDSAIARFQAISFFLLIVVLCSLVLRWIWNGLRKDFPQLPTLGLLRAGGLVLLWGVAMVVVLTMISGARELMTPGAWEKNGFTYRVADDAGTADAGPSSLETRMRQLEQWRVSLLQYAATHEGQYPPSLADLPGERPALRAGQEFVYVPEANVKQGQAVVLFERDLDPERRLAMLASGEIRVCTSSELRQLLASQESPP